MKQTSDLRRVRLWVLVFMVGLILSGLTAFPLQTEIDWLRRLLTQGWLVSNPKFAGLVAWIELVNSGITNTNARYPFLAYGTDWLAFAHLAIAIAFIGPYRDPVRNKWVITFGLLACGGVIPLALIAGYVREIPLGWRLLDCSFGVLGAIPLLFARRLIVELENEQARRGNVDNRPTVC